MKWMIATIEALKLVSIIIMIYTSRYIMIYWKTLKEDELNLSIYLHKSAAYKSNPLLIDNYPEEYAYIENKVNEFRKTVAVKKANDLFYQKSLVISSFTLAIAEILLMAVKWFEDIDNFKNLIVGIGILYVLGALGLFIILAFGWHRPNK